MSTYPFPFIAGLDESKQSKALDYPRLARLENYRITKRGLLRKRKGTKQIATVAPDQIGSNYRDPIGPVQMFNHDGQLVVAGQRALWTYSQQEDQLEELDRLPATVLEATTPLGHYTSRNVVAVGCARVTEFTVWAWVVDDQATDYHIHAMTVDNATGAASAATRIFTIANTLLDDNGPRMLKVIPVNDAKVTILVGDADPDDIFEPTTIVRYDITKATSGPYFAQTPTALISDAIYTDILSPQYFDAVPHGSGYLVAYHEVGEDVIIKRFDASHVQQATATITFAGANPRIQVCGNMQADPNITCSLTIATTTSMKVVELNDSLVQQGSSYNIAYTSDTNWDDSGVAGVACCTFPNIASGVDATAVCVNVDDGTDKWCRVYMIAGGAFSSGNALSEEHPSSHLCAKPFEYGGGVFLPVRYYDSQINSHIALMRYEPEISGAQPGFSLMQPEARILAGKVPLAALYDCAPSMAIVGTDVFIPFGMQDQFSGPEVITGQDEDLTLQVVGCDGFQFSLYSRQRFATAKVGGYTFLSGATIMGFDGRRCFEWGFWSFPELDTASDFVVSNGGSIENGWYLYAMLWEWTDYLGNRHQSAYRTHLVQVDENDDGDVTITMPSEMTQTFKFWRRWGDDARPISLPIYRSDVEGNANDSATATLFRLEAPSTTPFFESTRGSLTGSLGDYNDTYNSDTIALTSRERIYANNGYEELLNEPPPAGNIIISHDNRLWVVEAADPRIVWYSKQYFAGVAPQFNRALQVQFPEGVVALVEQDGNLVAFTALGRVFTVVGRPIDNTGSNTGYEPPQLLSTDRTCVDPRSIVSCPVGVLYQSNRGIEVLPRGGQANEWLGDMVRDTLETYPVITDALHVPSESEVLFSCVSAETTAAAGVVLVYNYYHGVWMTRNYQDSPISCMAMLGDDVVFGIYDSATGLTLWQEDSGFDDADGSFVQQIWQTSNLTLGSQGVRVAEPARMHSLLAVALEGEVFGNCTVNVQESRDDAQTWSTASAFAVTTAETSGLERVYHTKNRIARAHVIRCTTVTSGTADSAGVGFYGLNLTGKSLSGRLRLPVAQDG